MCKDCDILILRMTRPVFEGLQKLLVKNILLDENGDAINIELKELLRNEIAMTMTIQKWGNSHV